MRQGGGPLYGGEISVPNFRTWPESELHTQRTRPIETAELCALRYPVAPFTSVDKKEITSNL